MSIQFEDPMNDEAREEIKKIFEKKIKFMDDKNVLLERLNELKQKQMSEIANKAKQPVTFEINSPGDIKEMSDGTRYEATPDGWRKIEE